MKKILLLSGLFLAGQVFAQKSNIKFEEYTLDNGLHVILHEDHSTPIVAVTVLYEVGSKDEEKGKTGYAHFFEHLMFEESKNIGRDEYAKIVQSVGGTINANTSNDRTFYYEVLPSNQLELGLWMESERMLNAVINQDGVDNQREVVKEEKRQRYSQPYSTFAEEMFKRIYANQAYEHTPIGSFEDLNAAEISDFQAFYDKYYVPNNATLSIAGDIDIAEAKKYIKKYFSTIPKGETAITRPTVDQALLKNKIVDTVYDNIQLPGVFKAYKTVGQTNEDAYALDMIATILSGGKSARMYKTLVDDKQLALMAAGFPYSLDQSGSFIALGLANAGVEVEKVAEEMDAVINQLKTDLITENEYKKIQNQMEAQFISSNSRVVGIAETLANYHTYYGDANLINTEIEKYRKVTREDIRRVAKKYFVPSNSVTLYYLPKK